MVLEKKKRQKNQCIFGAKMLVLNYKFKIVVLLVYFQYLIIYLTHLS